MNEHVTSSQEETEAVGEELAAHLRIPAVILLEGELGAGKTTFTRGVVRGLGVEDTSVVRSPTFTLVNQYPAPNLNIYHIDLYRLDSWKDFESIGLEEILEEAQAVVLIEWAEKLPFPLPDTIRVQIEENRSTESRTIRISRASARS